MDTLKFETDAFPPRERLAAWKRFVAEIYYELDVVPIAGAPMRSSLATTQIGAIGVSSLRIDGVNILRRRSAIARNGESFLVCFKQRGTGTLAQGRREGRMAPGGVFVLNAAEHYRTCLSDATANVSFTVPGHMLRARLPWIDDACAREWISGSALAPIISDFGRGLLAANPPPDVASGLEGVCLDLVVTLLDSRRRDVAGAEVSSELPGLLTSRLRDFIRRNLGRIGLSAADAADRFGVSERQVQKLFQDGGTTFGRELAAARLDRADTLLRTAPASRLPIGEIAYRCGFSSQAHFAARFRERFGSTPRDRRATAARVELSP